MALRSRFECFGVRRLVAVLVLMSGVLMAAAEAATPAQPTAEGVLFNWNRMVLELVRHTPTYSPPVASRAFAYLGVAAYEAAASGSAELRSLAGQLNELSSLPARNAGQDYDEAVVMHAALSSTVRHLFANTGPTGQRAMASITSRMDEMVAAALPDDVVARSRAYGHKIGEHIIEWSLGDGGAEVENLGFPQQYQLGGEPQHWVPTSLIALQQTPLLPAWGANRTFAMPAGAACALPPPPVYSEDEASAFYREALEVYETTQRLDAEQEAIARFWSDDPMLSSTPPGHWLSITLQVLQDRRAGLEESVDVLARLGVAVADAFIGCWQAKYEFDLVRPVTYINRLIDPAWRPLLITPPFPEYPSGHSTQSAAAAMVLEHHFGAGFAFTDRAHEDDGIGARTYSGFWEAAEEAALSRLYGGIHFRAAIERGLDQGRCVAAYTNALVTRR